MDRGVLEVVVIALVSFVGLCLAWAQEADFFAALFAAGAVVAGLKAIERIL
jgi:hypothetical protein